jgi:hypothetical protein
MWSSVLYGVFIGHLADTRATIPREPLWLVDTLHVGFHTTLVGIRGLIEPSIGTALDASARRRGRGIGRAFPLVKKKA